jgi:hypothetical protein
MVVQRRLIMTESEKNNIRSLYAPKQTKNFVFDFVLTENEKYLIIMDQVFVAGGNGNSIGSIWENTHIFNELIKESLNKLGDTITEGVRSEVNNIIEGTKWTKENISEWVKESTILSEESVWDTIKRGGTKVLDAVGSAAESIFKQGILPFLRWVRRGLYTGVGMVIDVVVSILAVKSNIIIWLIICALDIYEIVTGDFDPKDPERKETPYMFLIGDLLAAVLTAGVGKVFNKSIPTINKLGVRKAAPTMVKMLQSLSKKLPGLSGQIKSATNLLSKKFKGSGVISTILRSVDKILTNLQTFIGKLLSVQGAKAVATGVGSAVVIKNTIAPEMGWLGKNKVNQDGEQVVDTYQPNQNIMADAERLGVFN